MERASAGIRLKIIEHKLVIELNTQIKTEALTFYLQVLHSKAYLRTGDTAFLKSGFSFRSKIVK
jgi:hypothetical protein